MKTITTVALALFFGQFLAAQSTLSGTVRDENHEPMPAAIVQLVDAATNLTIKNASTDGYGQFIFEGVVAGKYFIKAQSAAFGETVSKKTTVVALPVELPDLRFPKNAAGRAKKSVLAEHGPEKTDTDEIVFVKE